MARRGNKTYLLPHVDVCERMTKYRRHQRCVCEVASWGQGNCGKSRDCRSCAAERPYVSRRGITTHSIKNASHMFVHVCV